MAFIALSSAVGLGDTQFPLGLGMGMGVGAMQRRLIAERVQTETHWWRASIVGVSVPFLVWDLADLLSWKRPHPLVGAVVASGLTVGVLQWRVLRAHSTRSAWWILAAILGWTLAATTGVALERILRTPDPAI